MYYYNFHLLAEVHEEQINKFPPNHRASWLQNQVLNTGAPFKSLLVLA